MTEPTWTTINDAAARTGKSRRTIYRLIARDGIQTAQQDGLTLVPMAAVRASIARTVTGRPVGSAHSRVA